MSTLTHYLDLSHRLHHQVMDNRFPDGIDVHIADQSACTVALKHALQLHGRKWGAAIEARKAPNWMFTYDEKHRLASLRTTETKLHSHSARLSRFPLGSPFRKMALMQADKATTERFKFECLMNQRAILRSANRRKL